MEPRIVPRLGNAFTATPAQIKPGQRCLNEINEMDREVFAGIDFNLYVDKETNVR